MAAGFTFFAYRLRGNACSSPGSRRTQERNMFDVEFKNVQSIHWVHIKARSGYHSNQMVYKLTSRIKTKGKENAAALAVVAVFSSRAANRRGCGGRSTNGAAFAPPFTLHIHTRYMGCGPMLSDGRHRHVWPTLSGSQRCLLQDSEGWSFTFGPGRRCTFNASQSH